MRDRKTEETHIPLPVLLQAALGGVIFWAPTVRQVRASRVHKRGVRSGARAWGGMVCEGEENRERKGGETRFQGVKRRKRRSALAFRMHRYLG